MWQSWHPAWKAVRFATWTLAATGMGSGAVRHVDARLVLLRHPLHRMAGGAAELVGSGRLHHHHGAGGGHEAEHDADDEERQHRPVHARPCQPSPESSSLLPDCYVISPFESFDYLRADQVHGLPAVRQAMARFVGQGIAHGLLD